MKIKYYEYTCPKCGCGAVDGKLPLPSEPVNFWCQDCPFEGTTEDCDLETWEKEDE